MRKSLKLLNYFRWITVFLCTTYWQCKTANQDVLPTNMVLSNQTAAQWADMALYVAERTPSNTPTYASRGFGYIGLTMYESVVNGSFSHRSMAGQLNGLATLPKPIANKVYNWELSLNAAEAFIIKNIYEHTRDVNKIKIDSLERLIFNEKSSGINSDIVSRSVEYGQEVAKAIFEWSKTDGGYQGYKRNFDLNYVSPKTEGTWRVPIWGQSASQYPLHPYWGNNRTFAASNTLFPPAFLEYSTDSKSDYYLQFKEVYEVNKNLTQEQKEIALWWGDDPSATFTPPGHSFSIANVITKKTNNDLFKATETFARVGMATADAFINCWKCKYTYHSERPTTFIRANIEKDWLPFWPEPPFPAFASGHATQGAAMATVMSDLYGDNFAFIDTSHEGRPNDPLRNIAYKIRSYESFWAAANESAKSRLYGGIHCRHDNEVGLEEGKKIGKNINQLRWLK
jgi:PAP2 superfamily